MRKEILKVTVFLTAALLALCGCGEDGTGESEPAELESEPASEPERKPVGELMGESLGGAISEQLSKVVDEMLSEPVECAGTTFSIAGDSISTYQGYNPEGHYVFFPEYGDVPDVADTWWQRVADDLELTMLANSSSSGATVAGDSTGTDDPQCACNELRTGGLAGEEDICPDRIIVYLGANDMLEAVPLGDNDGTRPVEEGEIATFSDAYTLMLDKLEKKYPTARIYCCTLHPMGNYGTETPYVAFVNGIGLTAEDYGKVIDGIAKARGLRVIDLYDCGIAVENLQEMTSDGVHPTAAGMKCIAAAVEEVLTCRK